MSDELVEEVRRDATISDCGQYRYSLSRSWRVGVIPPLVFVMLNPSTADAYEDDPTIRRCVNFAKREGFGWMMVMNLFAGRATDPVDLFKMEDPFGPENKEHWEKLRHGALLHDAKVVCAWGSNKHAKYQAECFVEAMAGVPLFCLGTTKDGHPRHPLYLPNSAPLKRWERSGA